MPKKITGSIQIECDNPMEETAIEIRHGDYGSKVRVHTKIDADVTTENIHDVLDIDTIYALQAICSRILSLVGAATVLTPAVARAIQEDSEVPFPNLEE